MGIMLTDPTPDLLPLLTRIEQAERAVNLAIVDAMRATMTRYDWPRLQRRKHMEFLASLHSPSPVIPGQVDSSERIARVA